MSKIIDLARKFKALAERGDGGEKLNAERMLAELMEKHGLTIEDIEGSAVKDYYFNLTDINKQLWIQVVGSVGQDLVMAGPFPVDMMKQNNLPGNYLVESTAAEYIEIDSKFAFYDRLFNSELKVFTHAFLHANNLMLTPKAGAPERQVSLEEYKEYLRAQDIANKLKTGQFRKQIG